MKKIIALLMIVCITMGLTACGKAEPTEATKKPSSSKPTATTPSQIVAPTTVATTGNPECQHTFAEDAWQVVQVSTCKDAGYQARTCQNCAYTEQQELPLGDHSYSGGKCTVCGDTISASQGLVFVSEYSSNQWVYYFMNMGTCTDTEVIVPATHKTEEGEYPVVGIGTFASFNENVTQITFLSPIYNMPTYFFGKYAALEKVVFAEGQQEIYEGSFSDSTSVKEVIIPSTVTEIGKHAFSKATALESIVLPAGVQLVNEKAFNGCSSLKKVTLSEGLLRIGERAFQDCTALEAIYMPNTVVNVDGYAFYGCSNLTTIVFSQNVTAIPSFACGGAKNLTNVTLGDKVTRINTCAFTNCFVLEEINLPATVTFIGKSAFSGCMKLSTINFAGTMEQWKAIDLGADWNKYCTATVVHCADGDVPLT